MVQKNHNRRLSRGPNSQPEIPVLALLSEDDELAQVIGEAAGNKWSVIKPGIGQISSLIREPAVRLVIFDDESVPSADRGWALAEIRRCASKASIIYIAGEHDQEKEKLARARGVLFYTDKPVIPSYVNLLLQRQLQMHNGNSHLANP